MQNFVPHALKRSFCFALLPPALVAAFMFYAFAAFAATDDEFGLPPTLPLLPHSGNSTRHLPLDSAWTQATPKPSASATEFSESQWQAMQRRGIVRVELKPARPRLLTAPFSGLLSEILVRDGEIVEKDRQVAIFESDDLEKKLQNARDDLNAALQRLQNTTASPGRAWEQDRDRAGQELARRADAVKEAEDRIGGARLKAPVAGRVVEVFVKAGQQVRRGDPIVELAEPGDMEIVCSVPSAWVARLKEGHVIWVYVNETAKSYEAEFKRFAGRVNSADKSIKAYALFKKDAPELLPGMSGRADFFPAAGR